MVKDLECMVSVKEERPKKLVTAALPYINNVPHLGHIVGSHLPADIFARYCRAKGYETLFVGGTDEHGSTSEIAAQKIGIPIDQFTAVLHKKHKEIYDWFGISYDNFSRTSNPAHHQTVQDFFKVINQRGFVNKGKMKVLYSEQDNAFLPDRYVVGECPKCSYEEATGDQCEKCTTLLETTQLKNPRSAITGSPLVSKETEHLFLRLDKLQPELKTWIESQTQWRDTVSKLALGWIKEGLKERCITRDLKYGVKVPMEGLDHKVFYVWFDAPIGYVSSTKEARPNDWESFWKDPKAEIYNFLGKDNIPFHTIFWPGMVIAHGDFQLPKNVVGLQYLNFEGKKFSKSKGIGIFCERLPTMDIPVDMWRSYLTQVIPETNDSEFKWEEFQQRINSDLIDNYGNLVNRVTSFVDRRLGGTITRPSDSEITPRDKELIGRIELLRGNIEESIQKAEMRKAYAEVLELSSEGNKYIHDTEPWVAIKENPARANAIFYNSAVLLKALAICSAPFIPQTAKKVWNQLNLSGTPSDQDIWDSQLDLGETHQFGKPEILFRKLDKKDIDLYREEASKGTDLNGFFK